MKEIAYRIGTDGGDFLCRVVKEKNNLGNKYEMWSPVTNKWTANEYAYGVIAGFESGRLITAEQAEEYMRKHSQPKQ